jgi:hypothetical protein
MAARSKRRLAVLIGYAKISGKWGIALRKLSGNYNDPEMEECEVQRMVMVNVLCPRSSPTVRMSTPAMTNRLAKVWRRQCQVKSLKPAALSTGTDQ